MPVKYIHLRKDEILKTGVNRFQINTDSSRKFVTGFALQFDQKTDTAFYTVGLVSSGGNVINRVPISFFAKDHAKIRKDELFFPIDARAGGEVLYLEIERIGGSVDSVIAPKLDCILTTSDTQQTETYILQYEKISAA